MTKILGGTDEERLYLYNLKFDCDDDIVVVKRTDMPHMDEIVFNHKGRYGLVSAFCKPGMKVLDFPCGSGYGREILSLFRVDYEGRDNDKATIEYCKLTQGPNFSVDDLSSPHLEERHYNLIACIEGIEHIEQEKQSRAVKHLYEALDYDGILIITSPERGEVITNPYHKWEFKKSEFEQLLGTYFQDVQILVKRGKNHKGEKTNFMYGICYK